MQAFSQTQTHKQLIITRTENIMRVVHKINSEVYSVPERSLCVMAMHPSMWSNTYIVNDSLPPTPSLFDEFHQVTYVSRRYHPIVQEFSEAAFDNQRYTLAYIHVHVVYAKRKCSPVLTCNFKGLQQVIPFDI